MPGTSQQGYFRKHLLKASDGAPYLSLGRHRSRIFEITFRENIFTTRSYFLSSTCSLLPPSPYRFLLLFFPFLQFLWHIQNAEFFLDPSLCYLGFLLLPLWVTLASLHPFLHPLFFFPSCIPPFHCLLILLLRITWVFTESTNKAKQFLQKYFEVLSGCLFFPGLTFFVGTLRTTW